MSVAPSSLGTQPIGETSRVSDDIFQIKLPVPFPLKFVASYLVEDRDGSKLVLAPYSGLEADGVALTAWQNLETLQRVNMDVVQAFVNDYMLPGAAKSTAPEPNAA